MFLTSHTTLSRFVLRTYQVIYLCVCVCVCVCVRARARAFTSIHREGFICLEQLDYEGTD